MAGAGSRVPPRAGAAAGRHRLPSSPNRRGSNEAFSVYGFTARSHLSTLYALYAVADASAPPLDQDVDDYRTVLNLPWSLDAVTE